MLTNRTTLLDKAAHQAVLAHLHQGLRLTRSTKRLLPNRRLPQLYRTWAMLYGLVAPLALLGSTRKLLMPTQIARLRAARKEHHDDKRPYRR